MHYTLVINTTKMPHWMNNLFSCFGGVAEAPASKAIASTADFKVSNFCEPSPKYSREAQIFLDLIPIFWPYLSFSERIALRACCRLSRRLHDNLVTEICVCDNANVLSQVPRLPRNPLPTCTERTHEVAQTLHGFTARGCQPHLLFLCITEGHERRRHEEGLAVLQSLPDATSELAAVHLCGVPLTPQVARALSALLAAGSTEPMASNHPPASAITVPSSIYSGAASPRSVAAGPSLGTPSTISAASTQRSLGKLSPAPPALPLQLCLYGYDIVRPPAGVSFEMLVATAAPRLTELELWGCVGWPKRLSSLLHNCSHLRRFAVSFQPLCPADALTAAAGGAGAAAVSYATCRTASAPPALPPTVGAAATAAGGAGGLTRSPSAAAAVASGAVVHFPQLSAAITTAGVVKTIGSLHRLRSLELRGGVLNATRGGGGGAAAARPQRAGSARSKAAAERAAIAEVAPSVQQLASALYQLTGLTRLAIDGLNSATPLLTAVAAMKFLRQLELPDAAAPAAADVAAITRAAPRLVGLTLGTLGPRSVLDASASAGAAAAVAAAPEVLPLPSTLAALRVVRCRPTLRTMRSIGRTVEARAAAPAGAAGAAGGGGAGGGGAATAAAAATAPPTLRLVVPGIDVDMLDVEFDALQGFSRGSDGVLRATLLPEAADALAASIRLLAPRHGKSDKTASAAVAGGGHGGVASSYFGMRRLQREGNGNANGDGDDPVFGNAWTSELTIHNAQGSLGPPSLEATAARVTATATAAAAEAGAAAEVVAEAADGVGGGEGGPTGRTEVHLGCLIQPPRLVGHAVWIAEMRPLGLRSLELYGIGVTAGDLDMVAQLSTLQSLTLASGELEVDALPYLAALPYLEYLELSRCSPFRHRRFGGGGGGGGSASGTGYARASSGANTGADTGTGTGFARGSAGFTRASGGGGGGGVMGRPSLASSDVGGGGDGEERRPTGKRALLELCLTAPSLRKVLVVRCMGVVCRAESAEGPLGAEWVRQRLAAMGPRRAVAAEAIGEDAPAAPTAPAPQRAGLTRGSLGRISLGRGSRRSVVKVSEEELGWPEVVWD